MIVKSYRIGPKEYKKAKLFGAKSIVSRKENVTKAQVEEIAPGEYWLSYTCEEGRKKWI